MKVQGEAALVTGASAGLGKEVARALARQGAKVVMVARGQVALDAAVAEIREDLRTQNGAGEVHGLAFDVGDKEAVHRIAGAAAALVGSPRIVIHNASTLGPVPMPLLLDLDCEDLQRVLDVNLVGPFRLTKALAGPMVLGNRGGVVVFVSSDAAVSAYASWGAYSVSKAAQDHLARVFAAEVPSVRFHAFDPGEMDTKMHADALPEADPKTLSRPADVATRLLRLIESDRVSGSRVEASALEVAA